MNLIEYNKSGLSESKFKPGISLARVIDENLSSIYSNETIQSISSKINHQQSINQSEYCKVKKYTKKTNVKLIILFLAKYKTELCRNYSSNGYCSYSSRCQFAHGIKELRSRIRHPKYKTEICRNFLSGYCKYASRCQFLHINYKIKENSNSSIYSKKSSKIDSILSILELLLFILLDKNTEDSIRINLIKYLFNQSNKLIYQRYINNYKFNLSDIYNQTYLERKSNSFYINSINQTYLPIQFYFEQ
ncbi:unnamed protein product [Rotaria sordida]|uniref:C3H1-type domain-containing protein n=1 Tax=Rotaria sordida TaxID=392033 RepID=A0A815E2Y8_9BILA|nr:unnamed protein product [Rotaria sordida]CAF1309462.1 unnamed protein product [Rotaria sordida]